MNQHPIDTEQHACNDMPQGIDWLAIRDTQPRSAEQ